MSAYREYKIEYDNEFAPPLYVYRKTSNEHDREHVTPMIDKLPKDIFTAPERFWICWSLIYLWKMNNHETQ